LFWVIPSFSYHFFNRIFPASVFIPHDNGSPHVLTTGFSPCPAFSLPYLPFSHLRYGNLFPASLCAKPVCDSRKGALFYACGTFSFSVISPLPPFLSRFVVGSAIPPREPAPSPLLDYGKSAPVGPCLYFSPWADNLVSCSLQLAFPCPLVQFN